MFNINDYKKYLISVIQDIFVYPIEFIDKNKNIYIRFCNDKIKLYIIKYKQKKLLYCFNFNDDKNKDLVLLINKKFKLT